LENPVELGNLFKRYDRKFQMYVVYCQNKPKSEFIVSEYIDNYFEVRERRALYREPILRLLNLQLQRQRCSRWAIAFFKVE
jgi:triple functional domain protein